MTTEIAEQLRKAFEDFKQHNDERLAEIEKQGAASGETKAAVDRANADITRLQSELGVKHDEQARRIDDLEARLNRPKAGGGNYQRDFTDKQIEHYAAFQGMVQAKEVDPAHVDLDFIGSYRSAFMDWAKRGNRAGVDSLRLLNEMSVGSQPDGGYWIDPDTTGRIVEFIRETSPIRENSNPVTIDGGDALEGDYDVDEAGTGGWVGETGTRAGDTGTPQIWQYRIPVHEQYAEPRTTQRFLDMTRGRNVEAWLVRKVVRRFGRDENTGFVTGSGVTRPRGFTTYASGVPATTSPAAYTVIEQVVSGAAAALTADGLIDLVFALKSGYRFGAIFGGSRTTEREVRQLKDTQNNYLWQPDFTERSSARLLGFPWIEMADMPAIAAGAEPIVFGNLAEAYQVVDLGGLRTLRDDLTTKGRVKFYTTKYVGGDVINFEAIKLQTISA